MQLSHINVALSYDSYRCLVLTIKAHSGLTILGKSLGQLLCMPNRGSTHTAVTFLLTHFNVVGHVSAWQGVGRWSSWGGALRLRSSSCGSSGAPPTKELRWESAYGNNNPFLLHVAVHLDF
ncbi:unnamed protein product [Boreogadus saida]